MTATVSNLNLSSELSITPSRKRKRQFEREEQQRQQLELTLKTAAATPPVSCFTNAAFSSTPKKILARRRLNCGINKENTHIFAVTNGLEVKSIADIVKESNNGDVVGQVPLNPYEVLRKPPKKKKKSAEETACFENPALNLDLPEKQFNPYEIVREKTPIGNNNCFVNTALNLKTQDVPASRNPFEIPRAQSSNSPTVPCSIKIGLPFVPTVGCRIDFKDVSMSQLTPSKLLAEKLVFSPVVKGKSSLGSIGEETMDIGKELDRYQLELENSINEAKLRKNDLMENHNKSPVVTSMQINVEQTVKVTQKLTQIKETEETEQIVEQATVKTFEQHTEIHEDIKSVNNEESVECSTNPFAGENIGLPTKTEHQENGDSENPFVYTEEEYLPAENDLVDSCGCAQDDGNENNDGALDDSFDFKAPTPFVRAYTKPASPKLRVSRESLNSDKILDAEEEHLKKSLNVKSIIRKSIRKLMQPHNNHKHEEMEENAEKLDNEKHSVGIIGTIRQSLRRKHSRQLLKNETIESRDCEVSIIDSSERTMKFKSNLPPMEYVKIEDLTGEKKNNIRSSIRRSTREMGHQFMRTVFHKKHEEYDFGK